MIYMYFDQGSDAGGFPFLSPSKAQKKAETKPINT